MTRYTEEFKKNVVKKILANHNTSLRHIARENRLALSTTHGWLKKYGLDIGKPINVHIFDV